MDEYIGIPFKAGGRDRDGLDCWGLVRLVYRERLGVDLPAYDGVFSDTDPETMRQVGSLMAEQSRQWQQVQQMQPMDVLLIRVNGGVPSHVALYLGDDWMLHIMEGMDVTQESVRSLRWAKRITGAYRHAGHRTSA